MSENLTRNLHNNGSIEQRVLEELTAIGSRLGSVDSRLGNMESRLDNVEVRLGNLESRFESFDTRLSTMETRFTALEEKFDARLHETRPIWESVQQRLTEIGSSLSLLNRQFRTLIHDSFDLRSRVEKLEDNQPAI
jgi:predicted nuclease with TOPRIM domain